MGVDLEWLNKVWGDRDVEKKYKCENCVFDTTEIDEVKKHILENPPTQDISYLFQFSCQIQKT